MPNQDQPNQNNQSSIPDPGVSFASQTDLPPMPADFQSVDNTTNAPTENKVENPKETGSASPPIPNINNIISSPKKKFGTGKIIATILGILMLVGGLGAGTYLIGQKQLFQQKANECTGTCPEGTKGSGCKADGSYNCVPLSSGSSSTSSSSSTCDNSSITASACRGKDFGSLASNDWDAGCQSGFDSSKCSSGVQLVCENTSGTYCAANCECKSGNPSESSTNTVKSGWGIGKSCSNTSGSGDHCIMITCPNGCSDKCSESDPGATIKSGDCNTLAGEVASICGQVDLVNSSGVYCQSDGTFTDAQINCPASTCTPNKTSEINTTSTPTPAAPYCVSVSTWDSDWNLLSSTDRSSLTVGMSIYFCTSGAAPSGTFDMARFTINGVLQADTTTQRPSSTDYCQMYTIPSSTTTISVTAQVHHSTLGWF